MGKGLLNKLRKGLSLTAITGTFMLSSLGLQNYNLQSEVISSFQLLSKNNAQELNSKNTSLKNSFKNDSHKLNKPIEVEETIAYKMLQIEDSAMTDYPEFKYLPFEKLKKVVDSSKTFITKKNYNREELAELSKKIYSTINKIDGDLYSDLQQGDLPFFKNMPSFCYRYSLYFLAVGQANGLPFYGIEINKSTNWTRGHMLIRYDPDGKHDPLNPINKGDLNIEATSGEVEDGEKYSDKNYIKEFELTRYSIKGSSSLKNLNEAELLSMAYLKKASKNFEYCLKKVEEKEEEIKKEAEECNQGKRHSLYGYKILPTKEDKEKCLKEKNIEKKKELAKKEHKNLIEKVLGDCDKATNLIPNSFGGYYSKGHIYKYLHNEFNYSESREKNFIGKSVENYVKACSISPDLAFYKKIEPYFGCLSIEKKENQEYIENAIDLTQEFLENEKNPKDLEFLKNSLRKLEIIKKEIRLESTKDLPK